MHFFKLYVNGTNTRLGKLLSLLQDTSIIGVQQNKHEVSRWQMADSHFIYIYTSCANLWYREERLASLFQHGKFIVEETYIFRDIRQTPLNIYTNFNRH